MEAASSQQSDKEDDILDGMDLNGVSEQEKAEIKRALLESKQDQYTHKKKRPGTPPARTSHRRGQHRSPSPDVDAAANSVDEDAETQEPEMEVERGRHSSAGSDSDIFEQETLKGSEPVDDDDETQPPSDQGDEGDGAGDNTVDLDFSKSSQATGKDNLSAYLCPTDLDENSNKSQVTEEMDTSNNASQSSQNDTNISMDRKSQGSQGFSPRPEEMGTPERVTRGRSTPERSSKGRSTPEISTTRGRSTPERSTRGRSTPDRAGHGSTGGSRGFENERSAEGSQGSSKACVTKMSVETQEQKEKPRPGGSGSSENNKDNIKSESASSPQLIRHYRAVKTRPPPSSQPYHGVKELNAEQCAKAIYQLFETYRIKLRQAQKQLFPKMDWGDPIKSGQHQPKTIDIKRRGQTSAYLEISDDEEDFETEDKKAARRQKKISSDSDDEIKRRRNAKSNVDEEIMAMQTQEYDVGMGKDFQEEGPVRRGLRKRKPKVLVEETQDLDLPDVDIGRNVNFIVAETQGSGDEMIDYLSVKKHQQNRKQVFENPMQQAQLKDFVIPKKRGTKKDEDETWEPSASSQDDEMEDFVKHQKSRTHVGRAETEGKTATGTGRGRKRKSKKEPVTLVEDTQDVEAELSVKEKIKGGGRRKRQCFRLSSSSSEEEMSVPETQRLADSPELMIIEEKSSPVVSRKPGRPKGIITAPSTTSSNTAEMRVTVTVKEELQNEDPDSDKDSQSPVIKRSSRFKNKPVQSVLNKNKLSAEEVTRSLGQSGANNAAKLHASHQLTDPVTKLADGMNGGQQAGVKRLISRPESKESNASDGSIGCSQISNTNLDDSGDLYSTQIAGAGRSTRHTKRDVNQNVKSRVQINENNVEEILNLDSDDDVLLVKEVTKNFSRKKPVTEPMSKLGGKVKNNRNDASISQYFTNTNRRDDEINLKPGADGSQHVLSTSLSERNLKGENAMELDPVSGVLVKAKDQVLNKQNTAWVAGVAMGDITNNHVHAQTNQIGDTKQQRLNKRKQEMKQLEDIFTDEGEDESPIALHNFTRQEMARSVAMDTMMGGARPKTRRQSKPAETVTLIDADIEVVPGVASGSHPGVGGAKRRGRRGRVVEEAESEDEAGGATAAVKEEGPGVECPLCGVQFAMTMIEQHAATCDGSAPQQDEAAVDVGHTPVRHGHVRHTVNDSDGDSDDGPVHVVVEASVKDVLKDVHTSPGEEGEVVQCYVCDAYCPKGARYDLHLQQCMQRAKQQQLEVDSKGFQQAYRPPTPEEEPKVRLTRRRIRVGQATGRDSDSESPVRGARGGRESPVRAGKAGRESPVRGARAGRESPVRGARAGRGVEVAGGHGRVRAPTATVTRRDQKDDGYTPGARSINGLPVTNESSPGESETGSSSWTGSSSSSGSDGDDDDNITLGTLARAGSSSLVTGPWNKRQSQAGTQPDGSNTVPDWLRRTADSPIKSFVPVSMQENSEYFKKQFSYNEKRVNDRQKKRKRSVGKPKRRKRRKVRRKKKNN